MVLIALQEKKHRTIIPPLIQAFKKKGVPQWGRVEDLVIKYSHKLSWNNHPILIIHTSISRKMGLKFSYSK